MIENEGGMLQLHVRVCVLHDHLANERPKFYGEVVQRIKCLLRITFKLGN